MEPKHPQDSNIEPVTAPVDTTPFVTDTTTPVTSHSPLGAETPATPSQPPRWRRVLVRTLQVFLLAFIALVLFRIPHVIEKEKTDAVVAQIHATKLTMDDVMGTNLPPDPGALANATIAGVDANTNGIRDDVELAIFRDYATSSKTRAVLLQYALALQMEFTQPIVNTETVIAVAQETGRAHMCVGEILSRENLTEFLRLGDALHAFVESRQVNTKERKQAQKDFYNNNLRSYSSLDTECDIELSTLSD